MSGRVDPSLERDITLEEYCTDLDLCIQVFKQASSNLIIEGKKPEILSVKNWDNILFAFITEFWRKLDE